MASVAAGGATIILIKRWVTLIVIIFMQPCLWNADYAIMQGLIMQQSSIKSVIKNVIEKSYGPLECLQRSLMIT